ncbi:MAG: kelch repeat-containing protein [Anaerolineales bacterium]
MSSESPDELSAREKEILELVATGATNRQIATRLTISVNTVKTHLRNIFTKLSVESRTEAALWAVKYGVVEVEQEGVPLTHKENAQKELIGWESERQWPLRIGQYLALGISLLFVFFVTLWPGGVQGTEDTESPFVDLPGVTETDISLGSSSRWRLKTQLPTSRGRFAQAQIGEKIFVISGSDNQGWSAAVEVYDVIQDSWERKRDKPTPVANIGAVSIDGLIYVPGGLDASNQVRDILEVYDPEADTWHALTPLPTPLCAYAIAPFEDGFYLFGGWNGNAYLSSVYYYDVSSGTWHEERPMKTAKAFVAAATLKDRIYLVGGYDGSQEFSSCHSYDPSLAVEGGDPWQEHAPMSIARAGHAVTASQEGLYVVGGGLKTPFSYNERYDLGNNAWSSFESPILDRWRTLGVSTINQRDGTHLYAVGGWNGKYLDVVETYQTSFRVYLP